MIEAYAGQVLVVDDDKTMQELLEAELEEAGFRVTCVTNLAELGKALSQRSFDFALLDLFLGEENGLEAIPVLLHRSPYTKIIMMSAYGTMELAVDAMERGATTFIAKSKDTKALIAALKTRLRQEKSSIPRSETEIEEDFGMIGKSPQIQDVIRKIHQVKNIDSIVLITGESGTGKELVARAIHKTSSRSSGRFEAVNCGAIPETLLEAELFGHKKGAFTDAKTDRKGLFELCENGTLFLDEIGELPLNLQVKLLRVLQEKEVMPIGSSQSVAVNSRVLVATNRNLSQEVKKGSFRTDLFYRLNVFQIHLPALRERRMDIPALIVFFLERFNQRFSKTVQRPSIELEARLTEYAWPGNIRELQNALERAVILSSDNQLHLEDMLEHSEQRLSNPEIDPWSGSLSEAKKNFEKNYLRHLLRATRGNISEIARISGRYRADVYRLMSKYGIEHEGFRQHG